MPLALDTLLFWVGLAITSIGLIVFVMGRVLPDAEKKGDNRFEAFGIKIDVSNPSLLLVILGVVMMLVPKMIPQEARDIGKSLVGSGLPVEHVTTATDGRDGVDEEEGKDTEQPTARPPPVVQQAAEANTEVTEPVALTPAPVLKMADITPSLSTIRTERASITPDSTTALLPNTAIVAKPAEEKPASRTAAAAHKEKAAARRRPPEPKQARLPKPKPDPEPAVPSPQAPEKQLLVVIARADVDSRAGIVRETRRSFSEKLTAEMAQQVGSQASDAVLVTQQSLKEIRSFLKHPADQQRLCGRYEANALFVGDLTIPFAMSNIESAYWPDITLYLIDCEKQISRKITRTHLDPRYNDSFPFQVAISEVISRFIGQNQALLRP